MFASALLVFEVRDGGCRAVSRTSKTGHWGSGVSVQGADSCNGTQTCSAQGLPTQGGHRHWTSGVHGLVQKINGFGERAIDHSPSRQIYEKCVPHCKAPPISNCTSRRKRRPQIPRTPLRPTKSAQRKLSSVPAAKDPAGIRARASLPSGHGSSPMHGHHAILPNHVRDHVHPSPRSVRQSLSRPA
jgi:hypothetical protein